MHVCFLDTRREKVVFIHKRSLAFRPSESTHINIVSVVIGSDSGPEHTIDEGAVLREHLGPPGDVTDRLEDGIESDIDEFRIGSLGRIGQASDLVDSAEKISFGRP